MSLWAALLSGLLAGTVARRRPESGVDPAKSREVADLPVEIAETRGKASGAGDA